MSKGLQALEEIKTCRLIKRMKYKEGLFSNKLIDYEMTYGKDAFYRQIPIIEKELKEHEETKKELQQVMNDYQDLGNSCYKKLKALEILKIKRVQLDTLFSIFTYHKEKENSVQLTLYNSCVGLDERKLLQNEYDLLKEVLL